MVGPALASSFRQQASSNNIDGGAAAAAAKGYGSYGYSHNNSNAGEEYSSRGAYRRPSEEGSRGTYGSYSNGDPHQYSHHQQQASSSSTSMPYSVARSVGQQQNYQLQNSRSVGGGAMDDMQSSFGAGSSINGSGQSSTSPPPRDGSSSNADPSATATGGSSTSRSNNNAAVGSPEEIENSRRVARVHFDEFRAYLDAEGQRGESLVSTFRHVHFCVHQAYESRWW